MQETMVRLARQPRIAVVTLAMGMGLLAASYALAAGRVAQSLALGPLSLALCLIAGTLLAYQFPIYIRHNAKICVISSPLYLMAVLLPVPIAGTCIGVSMAVGELLARRARGTYLSDIATTAGRWMVIGLAGSMVAHVAVQSPNQALTYAPLVGCALVLWIGDLLTLPLSIVPVSREKPSRIIATVAREGTVAEGTQYLLGVLGALVASQQVWALGMLAVPAVLVYLAFKKEIDPDTFELLESMADTVDLRDPYMGGHSRRVAEMTTRLLGELNMHGQEARLIRTAARIHDLGKIDLPDTVLIKSGALTPEEEALVQGYPDRGSDLLSRYPDFSRGLEMVRHHHERWDGMGYPDKLAGTEIPFGARVIAIVDAFDAMTSDRPYRRALTAERAAEILRDGRDRQWDPTLVDAFLRSIGQARSALPVHPAFKADAAAYTGGRTMTA